MKLNKTFRRCLILVPHPDDETNIAGNAIHDLRAAGTEVFVAYATNGDWKYPAEIRQKEAIAALKTLGGIEKDHIFFLGYGDAYFDETHSHLFYANDHPIRTKTGHTETYGTSFFKDFAMWYRGVHSPYTHEAYCRDLEDLILYLKADLVICSDFDEHPDHRMLTLCFDEVMGRILRDHERTSGYCPCVLKAFAYCTAYCAESDFGKEPFSETIRPEIGKTEHYSYDMIDRSLYEWDKRIRILVSKEFEERRLWRNTKAKALTQHRSQPIAFRAERIINRDEVFWQRRTDSLSYAARVTASSGKAECLNDFRLYNVRDIDSRMPVFCDCLWEPDAGDDKREFTFEWNDDQRISVIVLYGNPEAEEASEEVLISFDNGETFTARLPERGCPLRLSFDPVCTRRCTIRVPAGTGVAECEFYEQAEEELRDIGTAPETEKLNDMTRVLNRGWYYWIRIRHKVWKILFSAGKRGK